MSFSFEEQVLMNVRFVLTDPENMVQGVWGADKNGKEVNPLSKNSVRFCVVGALERTIHLLCGGKYVDLKLVSYFVYYLNAVTELVCSEKFKHCPPPTVMAANDWFSFDKSHVLVLEILDTAIELLPTEET